MIMKLGLNFFLNKTNGGDVMERTEWLQVVRSPTHVCPCEICEMASREYVPIELREKKKMISKLKDMQHVWIAMHRLDESEINSLGEKSDEKSEKEFITVYKNHYDLWTQYGDKKPEQEPICKTCEFEISKKEVEMSDELGENCFKCFCQETEQEYSWH